MYKLTIMGAEKTYPQGTTWETIAKEYQKFFDSPIAAVSLNGKIRELFKKVTRDGVVEFFTLKDNVGHRIYVRTATMLFLKAVYDLYGMEITNSVRIDFAVGRGIFANASGRIPLTDASTNLIKNRMKQIVEEAIPFYKRSYSREDAIALFKKHGMLDKVKLFRFRRSSQINIYEVDGFFDYFYGYMLPNAGYVKYFDLIQYGEGFMLLLPDKSEPTLVRPFKELPKLYDTFMETHYFSKQIGVENVGDLNEWICKNSMEDLILVQEAEQERKIAEIARAIVNRGGVKFIMIAGPSSSGKTSLSHRLSIQLRTLGMKPHPIALDDYFVNREDTPLDENGNYNFECLEAIDVKLFNENMLRLLRGEKVEMPDFNFKNGQREYNGRFMQLEADDILVIEGIHGLNPKMSAGLPDESKFKIYISALTCMNIDEHNRIPTTDARLLRRMVRDARTRGSDAKRTLSMWPSVRRGEEENIFPYQEEADVMFNSVSIYELAVLKQYAEPLLFGITKDDPEYFEAKRLLKFLDYFLNVPSEFLPNNSISREFVGGSCFRV